MFFTTPIMKKLKARNTVQQYLRREHLRIDNITSIREIVKETRGGMVFNTLVPHDSYLMKNCSSNVYIGYVYSNLKEVKKRFDKLKKTILLSSVKNIFFFLKKMRQYV